MPVFGLFQRTRYRNQSHRRTGLRNAGETPYIVLLPAHSPCQNRKIWRRYGALCVPRSRRQCRLHRLARARTRAMSPDRGGLELGV